MRLEMRIFGDPVLRQQAEPVTEFDARLEKLAADMLETMREERGVGLAAQQVGVTRSICVVSVPEDYDIDEEGNRLHPGLEMPLVLVNPEITWLGDEREKADEGCLSFPGINGAVPRALEIRVSFHDLNGVRHEDVEMKDFLARVVQHEVDHLLGRLFIDRMSPVRRASLSGKLKRMKAETEERLGIR